MISKILNQSVVPRWIALILLAVFELCLAGSAVSAQPPSDMQAGSILAESGFQGGLVVQAGLQDAGLAIVLGSASNVVFHGLVQSDEALEKVRAEISRAGLYGRVSAMRWPGDRLPYADGMVNLLLDDSVGLDSAEVDRVLAPLGVAMIRRDGKVTVRRKPRPADVDEWTHSRRDATGNAVSMDKRVGPPRFTQWEALPRWNRGTKTSAMVSANGRIFCILDDSSFAAGSPTWSLIARDAYNGIRLWRHELAGWAGSGGGKKVGPAQVNRRLVAMGERVYAILGEDDGVSVLNAADGKIIRTLEKSENCEEFLVSSGVLVALINESGDFRFWTRVSRAMRIAAFDPETGALLWEHMAERLLPMTLTADAKQVVYHDGRSIRSLDLRTGAERWTSPPTGQQVVLKDKANSDSPGADDSTIVLAPQFAPTMIIYSNVVAFAGGRQLNVLSADDGHELWRAPYASSNYSTPVDLFGFNGSLWGPNAEMNLWRPVDDDLGFKAYDPETGTVRKSVSGGYDYCFQHHRCHQMKMVGNTVLGARAGIEFLNIDTGELAAHHWVRGSCYFGVLPANGLLYIPPHNCACYIRAKLSGFMALNAVDPVRPAPIPDDKRLQRGPAFGKIDKASTAGSGEWPTYRYNAARTGNTPAGIGAELLLGWETRLNAPLTAPVIANGLVFTASTEEHQLHAIDASSGKILWQRTLEGRIDSPPTVYKGVVLCGCRDGSVYALRASDGELIWRFKAAPEERLIVSRGQLESVWPVYGSVLVSNGTVCFAAGKSSYMDGGIMIYGLEFDTGRKLFENRLLSRSEDGSQTLDEESVDGYLNDILSSDGERIFMRHQALDLTGRPKPGRVTHMHGPDGYLSSDTTTRLLWTYAPLYTSPHQGAFYDLRLSRALFPSGSILVEGADTIYGFGQNYYRGMQVEPGGEWALFAAPKKSDVPIDLTAKEYRIQALKKKISVNFKWWKKIPVQAWAMVKCRDVLFVAGPRGNGTVSTEALEGRIEALLLAISPEDGEVLAEMHLPAMPVWDGMAVTAGNLYLTLTNGRVLCLWPADSGRPGKPLSESALRALLPPLKIEPEDGLLGRWRFDEGTGTLARDCSGRGHDAELSGNWGKRGEENCLASIGKPMAAVIPDAPHLHFGNSDFTLALWIKVEGNDVRLVGKENFPENWWVINLLKSGQAELVLGEGRESGRSMRAKTGASVESGGWSHLTVAVDRQAREVIWYVNGVQDSRHPIPAGMTSGLNATGSDIAIPSRHNPFSGLVSDFRIYGRALGPDRIRKIYDEM